MLEAISARLGRDSVRRQFDLAPEPVADAATFSARLALITGERRLSLLLCVSRRPGRVSDLAKVCGFDAAIAAEDLEALARHGSPIAPPTALGGRAVQSCPHRSSGSSTWSLLLDPPRRERRDYHPRDRDP